jgi:hypothetical protein
MPVDEEASHLPFRQACYFKVLLFLHIKWYSVLYNSFLRRMLLPKSSSARLRLDCAREPHIRGTSLKVHDILSMLNLTCKGCGGIHYYPQHWVCRITENTNEDYNQ